jgi:hypothetical protein
MPAVTLTIVRRAGRILVRRGKVEREFDSLTHLRMWVEDNRSRPTPEQETADALALLAKDAKSAIDLDSLSGKTVDVDAPGARVRA